MSECSRIRNNQIKLFQNRLLEWFIENGRHFPWRNPSATNYQLIISEILLQRTKAETVAKFYPGFIKLYPSWKRLSNATELELQQALKPIGLFRQRGTRLFKLAQEMKKRSGRFPTNRIEVEEMSMMGQYISNAYELFILNRSSPLLDVNMARVLERYFGPRKLSDIRYDKYLQELSHKVVSHTASVKLNWAILDFAALICLTKNPRCDSHCPLKDGCYIISNGKSF